MEETEKLSIKEVFDDYMDRNAEFEKEFNERTKAEIAYDNAILEELRKGSSIKMALDIASQKYPDEALQYNSENLNDIRDHYEYLLNHEIIKNRYATNIKLINKCIKFFVYNQLTSNST